METGTTLSCDPVFEAAAEVEPRVGLLSKEVILVPVDDVWTAVVVVDEEVEATIPILK